MIANKHWTVIDASILGQRYRIKDTNKGPEVWEVKWAVFWRKGDIQEQNTTHRRRSLLLRRPQGLETNARLFGVSRGVDGFLVELLLGSNLGALADYRFVGSVGE
jgi:hypothetical protein